MSMVNAHIVGFISLLIITCLISSPMKTWRSDAKTRRSIRRRGISTSRRCTRPRRCHLHQSPHPSWTRPPPSCSAPTGSWGPPRSRPTRMRKRKSLPKRRTRKRRTKKPRNRYGHPAELYQYSIYSNSNTVVTTRISTYPLTCVQLA